MKRPKDIRQSVAKSYARAIEQNSGLARSCCAGPAPQGVAATLAGYTRESLAGLPPDAVANSFGCGNPVALAEIREGTPFSTSARAPASTSCWPPSWPALRGGSLAWT